MKQQNILYISYDGLTDALGQSQILSYLSHLSNPQRRFVVMAYEKEENYEKNFQYVQEIVAMANIEWVKLRYTKKPPVLSTVMDVRRGIKKAKELHKKYHFDIVHCRGHISGIVGQEIKGTQLIFDMRAWWADEKKDSGYWNSALYKPVYNYFKRLEKNLFKNAAYNISLTNVGKKEILDHGFSVDEKIGVIPTCVNLSVFKPFDAAVKEKMRNTLGIPQDVKVLLYSGSIGGNYDMDRMVKIFSSFLKVFPSAYILVLSKDAISETFLTKLKKAAIINYIIKNVSYLEVSDYLRAGDVGMIFYKPAYSNIGRSPTKLAEYWASGVPVISFENIGDLDYLFQRYSLGGVLCKEDLSNIEEKIQSLAFGYPNVLRDAAIEYFGLQRGVEFYNTVYVELQRKS